MIDLMGRDWPHYRGAFVVLAVLLVSIIWLCLNLFGLGFLLSSVISTLLMSLVGLMAGSIKKIRLSPRIILQGVISAAILYLVSLGAASLVRSAGIFGSEIDRVYSLVRGVDPVLLGALLIFPISFGFEVYYRGFVQDEIADVIGPLGSILAAAALDASLHLVTSNVLFVIAVFLSDTWWGMTYRLSGNLSAPLISHILWDLMVFVIRPLA